MEKVVRLENINKIYKSGEGKLYALNNVNLEIEKGQFVAVVGTSGSGKTTLLNMLGGLDVPTSGGVFIAGKNISLMNEEERTLFRRKNIGIIFQDYNLVSTLNVYENIVLPLELEHKHMEDKYIVKVLELLSIKDKKNCFIDQLSGGQQQRVAIARALLMQPSIILADEPTGNLDSKTSQEVLGILKNVSEKLKQTVILVTHDDKIAKLCNYIIRIEDGKVVYNGGEKA